MNGGEQEGHGEMTYIETPMPYGVVWGDSLILGRFAGYPDAYRFLRCLPSPGRTRIVVLDVSGVPVSRVVDGRDA